MKFRDSDSDKIDRWNSWTISDFVIYYLALTGIAACLIALAWKLLRS